MVETGENPLIFDLRSSAAVEQDPFLIQGAIHLSLEDIGNREFPRDRDIVVYCSCPNEASSARLALQLQRKGFTRIRPLLGGIDAWRKQNFPVEVRTAVVPKAMAASLDNQIPTQTGSGGARES